VEKHQLPCPAIYSLVAVTGFSAAFRTAAHRFRAASPILFRAAALIFRRYFGAGGEIGADDGGLGRSASPFGSRAE